MQSIPLLLYSEAKKLFMQCDQETLEIDLHHIMKEAIKRKEIEWDRETEKYKKHKLNRKQTQEVGKPQLILHCHYTYVPYFLE